MTDFAPARCLRRVFLHNLLVQSNIGVHPHERGATQRVRIGVDLAVQEPEAPLHDRLEHVLDYEVLAQRVRTIATAGHINLVETLAERIAAACLDDPRVAAARIRVEKLDAFADIAAVGVEIERHRSDHHPPPGQSR